MGRAAPGTAQGAMKMDGQADPPQAIPPPDTIPPSDDRAVVTFSSAARWFAGIVTALIIAGIIGIGGVVLETRDAQIRQEATDSRVEVELSRLGKALDGVATLTQRVSVLETRVALHEASYGHDPLSRALHDLRAVYEGVLARLAALERGKR